MESSTIIKLRQAESTQITTNGSYSVNLKGSGVLLEKGDICKIHTAIIDVTAESVVELATPTRINMGIGKYIRNYKVPDNTATPSYYNYTATPATTPIPDIVTPLSIVCSKSSTGADTFEVTQVGILASTESIVRDFGGILLQFEYTEVGTGASKLYDLQVPKMAVISHLEKAVMFDTPLLIQGKKFTLTPDSIERCRKKRVDSQFVFDSVPNSGPFKPPEAGDSSLIIFGNGGAALGVGKAVLNVFEETLTFDLDAGTYTPSELTTIITDKMADVKSAGPVGDNVTVSPGAFPVNSACLRTIYDINDKIEAQTGAPTFHLCPSSTKDKPTPDFFLNPVVDAPASRTKAKNLLIGANEVSLNFDESLNKLNFDIIHFPIYITPGGATVDVPGIDYPTGKDTKVPIGTYVPVDLPVEPMINNGGIFFTSLTSQELIQQRDLTFKVGANTDFWTQLGFEGIVVQEGHDVQNPIGTPPNEVIPLLVSLNTGENITGAFATLDTIVDKASTGKQLVAFVGPTETSLTTPIISNREFNNVVNDEGYYLCEIGMNIPQRMIGGNSSDQTTSNKVQSIIGKYYTQGNFLQDDGSGSIVYQHQSDIPQLLSNLDVRILHADQTPPEENELGPKNSVFLEIIKTSQ